MLIPLEWPASVRRELPVVVPHNLIVLSHDPDVICPLSGEKATALMELEWPASVFWAVPVVASDNLIVQSHDPTRSACHLVGRLQH